MSLVLAADYRVPDFDHWWAAIAGDLAGLPDLGVHIVVVYRSLQDANRVFVTIGVREPAPVAGHVLLVRFGRGRRDPADVRRPDRGEAESGPGHPGGQPCGDRHQVA